MTSKIWFLEQNDEIVGAYEDQEIAAEERIYLREENPVDKVNMYSLGLWELKNYPDEYEFAEEQGLLDDLE